MSSIWAKLPDIIKVSIGILSTGFLSPQIKSYLHNGALSYTVGAILSAVAITVFSDTVLTPPRLIVSWSDIKKDQVLSPKILLTDGEQPARYSIAVRLVASSPLSRLILAGKSSLALTLSTGKDDILGIIEEMHQDRCTCNSSGGTINCTLLEEGHGVWTAWWKFTFQLPSTLPPQSQVKPVDLFLIDAKTAKRVRFILVENIVKTVQIPGGK